MACPTSKPRNAEKNASYLDRLGTLPDFVGGNGSSSGLNDKDIFCVLLFNHHVVTRAYVHDLHDAVNCYFKPRQKYLFIIIPRPASETRNIVLDIHCGILFILPMKLKDYMKMQGLTDAELAATLRKERSIVTKYRLGKIIPPLLVARDIEKATDGAVSYRDFVPNGKK